MAGLDMSTAVDCTVCAFTNDFEFLAVSPGSMRSDVEQYVSWIISKRDMVYRRELMSRGIPHRYDQDSHPSVDWQLS